MLWRDLIWGQCVTTNPFWKQKIQFKCSHQYSATVQCEVPASYFNNKADCIILHTVYEQSTRWWVLARGLHIIILNDTVIEQKSEITLLGVTLDDQLSFSSHARNTCRKGSCRTGVFLRLRNLIPASGKYTLLSNICCTTWHFGRSSDARKLEQIQERALCAVYCDNNSTYEELLQRAKLPTLHTGRLQAKYGLAPPYICCYQFSVSS